MKMVKKMRSDPERISPNLRYIDGKMVLAATVKINQIVSWIKTETIIEKDLVLHAAGNIVAEMVGYKKQGVDRKHTSKLAKKNFREAEGIT